MTSLPTPPQNAMTALVRDILTQHTTWDAPHQFAGITWDGTEPRIAVLGMIDPAIHPTDYPGMITRLAGSCIRQQDRTAPTLTAYALQIEAYMVVQPKEMTAQEAAQFDRDRRNRTFHQRPDSVEQAMVMCVDMAGRFWSATKRRDRPGDVAEVFEPSLRARGAMTGAFVEALSAAATSTAAALYRTVPASS